VVTGEFPPGSAGATPITFPQEKLLDGLSDKFWVDAARVVN